MMERDEDHFFQYILNEFGTSGARDGPRARDSKEEYRQKESKRRLLTMLIHT